MIKQYTNVFEQAEKHPKAKLFHEENLARIRLAEAEAIHREHCSKPHDGGISSKGVSYPSLSESY